MTDRRRDVQDLRTVLVVEDDEAVRSLVAAALGDIGGLDVRSCGSATEALAVVSDVAPDLFLLDVQLPDMDGAALAGALRTRPGLAGTPTVLLTGRPDLAERMRHDDAAIIGVLGKPFDVFALADALRAVWTAWRDSRA
ncbi:response regulator [Roseospira goensis]|uniref:CheY-like chemotaxis protein n=1 Tax=Roseospira goensis TaxID=391922 RepID=A0A7W6WJW2_9PROT|nr:response regulator [Roseospira goensis]MBB4284908.1 CheY-like chemotaxis protein [Roseospira goensis]